MAQQTINVGTVADDGTGDTLRAGFVKANDNFDELYAGLGTALQPGDNVSELTNDAGFITEYVVTEGDVTAHQAALEITESQISDFGTYLVPGEQRFSVITESGTTRTLALSDAQLYIRCDNASGVTVTVPPQSSVAWEDGTEIVIEQAGAGQVTIAAGAGVTIRTPETLLTAKQYAAVSLKRVAADEWVLGGFMEAAS